VLPSHHEVLPEVSSWFKSALHDLLGVNFKICLVALSSSFDSYADIHIDLERDSFIRQKLNLCLVVLLREWNPIYLANLFRVVLFGWLKKNDTGALKETDRLKNDLFKWSSFVLAVHFNLSDIIRVVKRDFFRWIFMFGLVVLFVVLMFFSLVHLNFRWLLLFNYFLLIYCLSFNDSILCFLFCWFLSGWFFFINDHLSLHNFIFIISIGVIYWLWFWFKLLLDSK